MKSGDFLFNKKNPWFVCLKDIVLASLAEVGGFIIFSLIIYAAFAEIESKSIRYFITYIFVMVIYAIVFYRIHMYNRLDTFAEHKGKFDFKQELLAYIRAEGKIIFTIYGAAAVVSEISDWIMNHAAQNPIVYATSFCLGPWMVLEIPILRAVIAFVYASSIVCLLAVLRSRKIYQNENQKIRR